MDVWLTPQNLQAFHTIDRTIYGRLVINVGFRHIQAKQVIAFWNWLETIGFSNFVYRLLTFPDLTLRLLAIETLTCFRYLYEEGLDRQSFTFVDKKIPILLGHLRQRFSFSCLYENRQNAISRMEEFIRVFDIAFSDRVPANYLFQFQNAFRPPSSNGLHLRLVYGTPSVTPRKSHLPASIPRARTFLITSCMGQEELQDLIARCFLTHLTKQRHVYIATIFSTFIAFLFVFS
jgi:hypothetical protein